MSRSEHEGTKEYQMCSDTFNVTNPVVLYNSTTTFSFTANTILFILIIIIRHINKTTRLNQLWSPPGQPESQKSGNMAMYETCVK